MTNHTIHSTTRPRTARPLTTRPRTTRRAVMAVVTSFAMTCGLTIGAAFTGPAAHAASPAAVAHPTVNSLTNVRDLTMDQQLVVLINKARVAAGRAALVVSPGIEKTASYWSTQLTTAKLAHNPRFAQMIKTNEKRATRAFGENVAGFTAGAFTAEQVFAMYMGSSAHRANILSPAFRYVGVVTVRGSAPFAYNTMNFGG